MIETLCRNFYTLVSFYSSGRLSGILAFLQVLRSHDPSQERQLELPESTASNALFSDVFCVTIQTLAAKSPCRYIMREAEETAKGKAAYRMSSGESMNVCSHHVSRIDDYTRLRKSRVMAGMALFRH